MFEVWPAEVAWPIAAEVNDVLTAPRGGLLTFGAIMALYFSSSAIEALRTGLNRAYDEPEKRAWYWLRLQSIVYVLIGAAALLALAFLVVLGPLIFKAALAFAPGLEPLGDRYTVTRLTLATLMTLIAQLLAHLWLPAARLRIRDVWPGVAVTFVCSLGFGEGFGLFLSEYAETTSTPMPGLPM